MLINDLKAEPTLDRTRDAVLEIKAAPPLEDITEFRLTWRARRIPFLAQHGGVAPELLNNAAGVGAHGVVLWR